MTDAQADSIVEALVAIAAALRTSVARGSAPPPGGDRLPAGPVSLAGPAGEPAAIVEQLTASQRQRSQRLKSGRL